MATSKTPKLISLDIIDLNKRLRKRHKKIGTNLWDLLPDDVMPNIVKYKVKMDFDNSNYYENERLLSNSLYNSSTLDIIAENIIEDNKWDFKQFFQFKLLSDDLDTDNIRTKRLEFVIIKLQDVGNLNYLEYFKQYTKNEIIQKRFKVGKTYFRTFKNTENDNIIKIPFTIISRDECEDVDKQLLGHFTANIDGSDVNVRFAVLKEYKKRR